MPNVHIFGSFQVRGTDYKTSDGTCIRDYIDVTDLVDAHVKALEKADPGRVGIYNVGTGKGRFDSLHVVVNSHIAYLSSKLLGFCIIR